MERLFRAQLWQSPSRLARLAWRRLADAAGRAARRLDRALPTLGRYLGGCCGRRVGAGEAAVAAFAPCVADLDEDLSAPGPAAPRDAGSSDSGRSSAFWSPSTTIRAPKPPTPVASELSLHAQSRTSCHCYTPRQCIC